MNAFIIRRYPTLRSAKGAVIPFYAADTAEAIRRAAAEIVPNTASELTDENGQVIWTQPVAETVAEYWARIDSYAR